ncbi:taste receptor type 2 member 39-like [Hyla sarda]|uniref:taste receptor type 2 member 39-like n=1 Tax=Hyla sarda TaxID=327740 RepID=UPI0024C3AF45|nr:taste receptor type 2 member 39-like [Hyla sarda]
MEMAAQLFLITFLVITWISGIALSSFIVIVYIIEWKKKEQFNVCDRIFVFMALNNLLRQSSISFNVLKYLFWFHLMVTNRGYIMVCTVTFLYLIYDSIWHSAWLSMYYCVKLVNSSHRVIVMVKHRLSSSVTLLLITTSVASFLINLPYIWTMSISFPHNNSSLSKNYIIQHKLYFTYINVLFGCCLPFLVTFICIGVSVGALVRHMWRMRHSASQFSSSPQLQGHVRATRTMILQVLLNLFLYVSVVGMLFVSLGYIWSVFIWLLIMSSPSIQIITLIMGYPKLQKKIKRHLVNGGLDKR